MICIIDFFIFNEMSIWYLPRRLVIRKDLPDCMLLSTETLNATCTPTQHT